MTVAPSIIPPVTDPVRELYGALREQAMARVDLALKVAVLQMAGVARGDIAAQLDVGPKNIRKAVDDLREIAPTIELGERPDGSES